MNKLIITVLLFIVVPITALATTIDVCFSPNGNCANKIIKSINEANKQILVQAYSFTDHRIAQALEAANFRGVDVEILLDKSQLKSKDSVIKYLQWNKISTKIDYKPAIAHNKIMIIDSETIVTGSYNFTYSAEKRNAENLLIIHDKDLAGKYINNFIKRNKESKNI